MTKRYIEKIKREMSRLNNFEEFLLESQISEMRFTSAGVRDLITAIYYNWEKLKKAMKEEMYFDDFKQILDFMKYADQEEQMELENFVKSQGVEILALDKIR